VHATAPTPRTAPFPVMLLAHARPEQLNETLASLLAVRGLNASRLYVMQDGTNAQVSAAVRARGLPLVALPAQDGTGDDKSGSSIARAYGAALSKAFELSGDEALLVVEDDLLFSPDLMEYFLAGYHVLKADPSLWCVSAWNDNGFGGLVRDQKRLLRTGFFPGLGWLLTRKLYEEELRKKWPTEHWDHWMRSETVHRTSKGRECLFPEVSRTFHNGARGTFMNPVLHSQFFAKIAYSTDPDITWPRSEWEPLKTALSKEAYERRLREALGRATPLSDLTELFEHGRHERAQRGSGGRGGSAASARCCCGGGAGGGELLVRALSNAHGQRRERGGLKFSSRA